MTETIPGPDGAVPVDELVRATVVISGTKPSTCDACRSAIATRTPSFVAHGSGGRRWRLCRSCAPETLGGFPLAWGRSCTWRASDTRTIEAEESRERQDDDNSRSRGDEQPWAGSGWDKPPVTPEERGRHRTTGRSTPRRRHAKGRRVPPQPRTQGRRRPLRSNGNAPMNSSPDSANSHPDTRGAPTSIPARTSNPPRRCSHRTSSRHSTPMPTSTA